MQCINDRLLNIRVFILHQSAEGTNKPFIPEASKCFGCCGTNGWFVILQLNNQEGKSFPVIELDQCFCGFKLLRFIPGAEAFFKSRDVFFSDQAINVYVIEKTHFCPYLFPLY